MAKKNCLRAADGMELMARFAKRQPALRMLEGGQASDPTLNGAVGLATPTAASTAAAGVAHDANLAGFAKSTAALQAMNGTAPAAPPTTSPTGPQKLANASAATSLVNSFQMQHTNPMPSGLQLRNGGTLRTGQGGAVPGSGHGDKIDAKYEPGEFVVSNAMLAAKPGLRKQLHDLRGKVLAKKGMTPAQADAKATGGGMLRAVGGATDWTARSLQGQNMVPPAAPVQSMADSLRGGTPAIDAAAPKVPLNSPQAQAWQASRTAAPVAAPTTATPATPYSSGARVAKALNSPVALGLQRAVAGGNALAEGSATADNINSGNYAGALDHGLRSAASTALATRTPAALVGGAYLGGAAAGDFISSKLDDTQKMGIGHAVNTLVRGAGDLVGQDWGVDDTALKNMGTPQSAISFNNPNQTAATRQRTGLRLNDQTRLTPQQDPRTIGRDPSRPELGASRDFTNELSGRPNGRLPELPKDLREGVVHKTVDAQGRVTYSGRNVAPGADGTTQMVDGMGRSQKMRGSVETAGGMPGMTDAGGGGYAFTPATPGVDPAIRQGAIRQSLRNPDGSTWGANDNAIMASNLRDGTNQYAGTSRGQKDDGDPGIGNFGHNKWQANQTLRRGQDMEMERARLPFEAQAQMRKIASQISQRTGGDHAASARMAMEFGSPEMAKQFQDLHTAQLANEGAGQTLGTKARENTRKEFNVYDSKDPSKVDERATQEGYDALRQIVPDLESSNERTRNAAMPDAKALHSIFMKARSQDKVGWDAMKFWEPKRPTLSSMPDAKGGKHEVVSGVGGWMTLGASNGDTLLQQKDGRQLNLGQLNTKQLELLERAKKQNWGN
jgi:hypothetical protein